MPALIDLAAVEDAVVAYLSGALDSPEVAVYGLEGGLLEGDHAWIKLVRLALRPMPRMSRADTARADLEMFWHAVVPTPLSTAVDRRRLASTAMQAVDAVAFATVTDAAGHVIEIGEPEVVLEPDEDDTPHRSAYLTVTAKVTRASGETLIDAVPVPA